VPANPTIYRPSPARVWGGRLALLALAAVALYLVFELGRLQAGHNIADVAEERRALNTRIVELEGDVAGLQEEIARLETHREIDAEAYGKVEASLADLQAKIREQRDAIAFYRGIVSPEDGGRGLRVQDLSLTAGRSERNVNLRLVLVQAMRHDRRVTGDVVLQVQGEQDGIEKTYGWAELKTEDSSTAWPFGFRYFQDFERELVLPDGFTPLTVKVEIRSKTRSINSIEETYDWALARG